MAPGRPKTPTRIKVIRHTFRKDRASKSEPQTEVLTRTPPPPASLPRAGRALWQRQAPELVRVGILTSTDLEAFEAACLHWGVAAEIYEQITQVTDPKTKTKRRRTVGQYLTERPKGKNKGPMFFERVALVDRIRAEHAAAMKILTEYGFTPAARSRLDIMPPEKPEESAIRRMLSGS